MPSKSGKPYLAFIGDLRTSHRLLTTTFCSVLGERLGVRVIDVGDDGQSSMPLDTAERLSVLNAAEAVIVQMSSRALGADGREPRMRRAAAADFAQLRAARAEHEARPPSGRSRGLPSARGGAAPEIASERARRLIELIEKVAVPRILLQMVDSLSGDAQAQSSDHAPVDAMLHADARETAEIAVYCDARVQCEYSFATMGSSNRTTTGADEGDPFVAGAIAMVDALEPACRRFLGHPPSGHLGRVRFVVVGAARTGTSLLVSLLNANRECLCGGELFNEALVAEDIIPWRGLEESRRGELLDLRHVDAAKFWDSLSADEISPGRRAVGFKLLYWHGLERPSLLESLTADKSLRVIHITRRNLLRRAISERRAEMTDRWVVHRGAPIEPCPRVPLLAGELASSIARIEAHQREFDTLFADHPTLRVIYEDLANDPDRLAARASAFLGLEQSDCPVPIKYERTGASDLTDAVVGLEELRARVRRWASFFDD